MLIPWWFKKILLCQFHLLVVSPWLWGEGEEPLPWISTPMYCPLLCSTEDLTKPYITKDAVDVSWAWLTLWSHMILHCRLHLKTHKTSTYHSICLSLHPIPSSYLPQSADLQLQPVLICQCQGSMVDCDGEQYVVLHITLCDSHKIGCVTII